MLHSTNMPERAGPADREPRAVGGTGDHRGPAASQLDKESPRIGSRPCGSAMGGIRYGGSGRDRGVRAVPGQIITWSSGRPTKENWAPRVSLWSSGCQVCIVGSPLRQ
ncbi:hypothetical protein GCM10010140_48160 [Streptosporangium pseudovulgare]|uniref:Uncharacterized protein n=1 Tax=Streptosporangium pseudovulgare TaxID=35765 RepID=A0ABQ2R762_9ACTN|nr:hypothetical protein GCM10010140_48160 [Streptosporangium pseudovulgare]